MNARKFRTDPALLLEQGKAIISTAKDGKFRFKVFAVNMVLSGCTAEQVSAVAGVTKRTVNGWVSTVDQQGFDALQIKPRSGRPPKLSSEQRADVDMVLQSEPGNYGYKVWDGPSLSAYINSTFGIPLSIRQCQRLMHELGYSYIRPQPYPSKGYEDTKERNEFKKTPGAGK